MSTDAQIYLITGANRGIGLALVKEVVLKSPKTIVVAGVRDPSKTTELKQFADSYPGRIDIVKCVSADVEGNKKTAKEIQDKYGRIDVVIANAAIANYVGPTLEAPLEDIEEHFKVNVAGNLILFQAVYSLLKASKNPKFVPITSAAGSITMFASNTLGLGIYGASKSALNYISRNIHAENEWLVTFPLNPGPVETDMAKGARDMDRTGQLKQFMTESVPRTPEEAAKILIERIENANREKEGGKFMDIEGEEIPW